MQTNLNDVHFWPPFTLRVFLVSLLFVFFLPSSIIIIVPVETEDNSVSDKDNFSNYNSD